jgi:hypothetical protein
MQCIISVMDQGHAVLIAEQRCAERDYAFGLERSQPAGCDA